MNMQAMMQQAQKLQKEIEVIKEELNNKTFTHKKGFFEIQSKGTKEIVKIKIDKEAELDEMFEDLLLVTINELFEQIDKEKQQKMGKFGPGLNGLI